MLAFAGRNGLNDRKKLIDYGMALVQKYGEGSGELACEMYDAIARLQGARVPAAKPADIPDYGEVAKSVNGVLVQSPEGKLLGDSVSRLVKQVGADTMLKNARRDHAEFAWIPSGDACSFCTMIASNGWQRATRQTVSGDHAEHIHANCQCEFAIRFSKDLDVAGYEPEKLREEWDNAEGTTQQEKLNSMRRQQYAEENDNGPDFYTGANGKTLLAAYKEWIGDNKMKETLESCESEEARAVIRSDFRKKSFIGDGDTASIRRFEIETGLKCGRNGGDYYQKVKDLIRQIERTLLKDIPERDKLVLRERLQKLREVSGDGV